MFPPILLTLINLAPCSLVPAAEVSTNAFIDTPNTFTVKEKTLPCNMPVMGKIQKTME